MPDPDARYVFFWSGPFSQWQRAEFEMDGVRFNTAEQAMMFFKARLFSDDRIADLILSTRDARKQKALGRKVKGFDSALWDQHKHDIVLRANRAKFSQNKGLRRKLFQTGDRLLVEASPLDTIWGIGLDAEQARQTPEDQWPGQNLLGRIVTQVREELRAQHPEEAAIAAFDPESTVP